jgi:oxalate decarboxylase/phosphoglucose isomerase-like protein (cupin superfamily)
MKMRRIVSAEGETGVVMQVDDLLDTETADRVTNIWGFDEIPQLPLTAKQVLGEYKRLGIFGPKDSVRVDLQVIPPEKAGVTDLGSLMAKIDFGTGGGMTQGEYGGGMHRTDTVDLAVVLKGEVDIAYPGENGQVHTTTAKEGDFFVQNGAFHEFHNRSDDPCVILMFVFGAERKAA